MRPVLHINLCAKIFCAIFSISTIAGQFSHCQQVESFDVSSIYDRLDNRAQAETVNLSSAWWDEHVSRSQRNAATPVTTDLHSLMYLALKHSNQIRIASAEPLLRRSEITERDSSFDWVRYLDTGWNDTSQPVSTVLDAGGTLSRLNDQTFQLNGGLRKTNRYGGQFDISNRLGWQDSNSTFFVPENQATTQLLLSYSQPLLRGRGHAYNTSLVVLAQLDAETADANFRAELQNQLLEVARAYWLVYQERARLAQNVRLFIKTDKIVQVLQTRQQIDAQRSQLISAEAALENRRSDLIRSRTAVINAETRLRGLINAPELGNSDELEVVPIELPSLDFVPTDLADQLQIAIQNRPEATAAIRQVKAGSTRLGIAQNEMMPALNLVLQSYANGLEGDSNFNRAFSNQFSSGRPSYSVGLQYEFPIGNRAACARLQKRKVEMRRLQAEYSQAITAIQTEVDIALREFQTSYREITAKHRALKAAEAEAETIRIRWSRMVDGNGTSALNLESLLRAQERVTDAEGDYVTSVLTYNLAVINLKKSNGTLLQSKNVTIGQVCDRDQGPFMFLDMDQPIFPQTIFNEPAFNEPPFNEPTLNESFLPSHSEAQHSNELKLGKYDLLNN